MAVPRTVSALGPEPASPRYASLLLLPFHRACCPVASLCVLPVGVYFPHRLANRMREMDDSPSSPPPRIFYFFRLPPCLFQHTLTTSAWLSSHRTTANSNDGEREEREREREKCMRWRWRREGCGVVVVYLSYDGEVVTCIGRGRRRLSYAMLFRNYDWYMSRCFEEKRWLHMYRWYKDVIWFYIILSFVSFFCENLPD